ncbi:MAG: hypothetical protein EHM19_11110 [Candidatus Latescibacterota bacterium]|nr:MAG: hypothetical protein EHM19_11110 [Candidatus Latescibacterota bacterium]
MRACSWKTWWVALGCGALVAFAAIPSSVRADYAGMDVNSDLDCDPLIIGDADMGRVYTAGDVGVQQDFDIFFDDIPNKMVGYGCTFCVTDSTHLGVPVSWTYADAGWTNTTLARDGDLMFTVAVSPYIISTYPKYICWLVTGADFTLVGAPLPHVIGTFSFQVASEGPITWIFDTDPLTTAVQTSQFLTTYDFDDPGETCITPAAVEQGTSWGAVKQLFR